MTPCNSLGTNVLEEPATSIFRVEELMCTRQHCATSQNVSIRSYQTLLQ